ncbi:MAG TPA: lysophospholipid acyltransferase family protein [Burkholderiaceae bacterium]|nr:lysophospholipid acyltransferase family protein [Burkholderiaceae bacterium]
MATAWAAFRSTLFFLWMAVTVIPWALAVLVASLVLPSRTIYWMCAGWLRIAVAGARWICGVRRRVQGFENLPSAADARAAVILVSKHQSTWETFAYPTLMPHPLAYVFKRELLRVPFFGWAMSRMDMIHIDRSRHAEAWNRVAAQGRRLAGEGIWVIMFPEGTRIPRGERGRYKSGASRLAVDTGVPLVPIAVTSARCWPRRSFLLRPGVVDVSIGKPIPVAGHDAESLMRVAEEWIESEMNRLDPPEAPSALPPRGLRQGPGKAGSPAPVGLRRAEGDFGGVGPPVSGGVHRVEGALDGGGSAVRAGLDAADGPSDGVAGPSN